MNEEECKFPLVSLSAYWTEELEQLIKERAPAIYLMSLVGEDKEVVIKAVNKGIDSHLEACFCPDRGDRFEREERAFIADEDTKFWKKGERVVHTVALGCSISAESLPVLVRRLMEMDEEEDPEGNGHSVASAICDGLHINLI